MKCAISGYGCAYLKSIECLTFFIDQLVVQDVVLLNKIDLVIGGEAAVKELESRIFHINALAKVVHSVRCQVDLKDILECRAYEVQVRQS